MGRPAHTCEAHRSRQLLCHSRRSFLSGTPVPVYTKSSDLGERFSPPREIVAGVGTALAPFDQASDPAPAPDRTAFRTSAYPALAVSVDATGRSRVHVAWARRGGPEGEGALSLAEHFAREARVRIDRSFRGISVNSDADLRAVSREVLDGRYEFAERGIP